jgi:hypothetical protein
LAVGDQDTVGTDDEETDGRESRVPDVLVTVDVVGKLDGAGKLGERQAAFVWEGRPYLRRR